MLRDGLEIAFEQFVLSPYTQTLAGGGALTVIDSRENFGVHGQGFSVIFAKKQLKNAAPGMISSLKKNGRELLSQGCELNFWRAETSNDKGNDHGRRCAVWRYAGKYISLADFSWEEAPGQVTIDVSLKLFTEPESSAHITYTVHGDGRIDISYQLSPDRSLPEIPVIGFLFTVNNAFEHLRWYGRGPFENYIDRQSGAKFGIYTQNISENLTPYMTPQECGNRTDIRWARISDGQNTLVFEGAPFECNAQKWTWSEIENARHAFELPPQYKTVISINHRQEGIAGDDTWGSKAMASYLTPCDRDYTFCFTLSVE